MHHIHIIHWLLDFMGVNNTYNSFSTHMYNFWSGFGGGIIQFSLLGALVAMYRHYLARSKVIKYVAEKAIPHHHEDETVPDVKKKSRK